MPSGKDFEDSICTSLEGWVGDDGYVWLRRQTRQMRRGEFGMGQELDILLDSKNEDYYVGIEAKSRDVESSSAGLYFSKLNPDQFLGQDEYRKKSGRKVAVAVELRNCCDRGDCAYLLPLDLFLKKIRNDATKISWDEVREYGTYLGSNGDFELSVSAFDFVSEGTIRATEEYHNETPPSTPSQHDEGRE